MLRVIPNRVDLGRMADDVARALSHSVAIESAEFEVVWCLVRQEPVRNVL